MKKFFTGDQSTLFTKLGIVYGHILTDGMDPESVFTVKQAQEIAVCMAELSLIPEEEVSVICQAVAEAGVCKDVQAIADLVSNFEITWPDNFESRWEFKFEKHDGYPKIYGVITSKKLKMTEINNFLDALDVCDQFFRGRDEVEMSLEETVYILKKVLEAKLDLENTDDDDSEEEAADNN